MSLEKNNLNASHMYVVSFSKLISLETGLVNKVSGATQQLKFRMVQQQQQQHLRYLPYTGKEICLDLTFVRS